MVHRLGWMVMGQRKEHVARRQLWPLAVLSLNACTVRIA